MKIGAGIITCNRQIMFEKCFKSIPSHKVDELIIINDGEQSVESFVHAHNKHADVVNTSGGGVGAAKNAALKYLIDKECDYIFLIEDDMLIFEEYIKASKATGLHHMMFAYHGPANKNNISGGPPCPRAVLEYPSELKIALNQHCVGAFCMYTKESLQKVGLFDTRFHNAFEHVHHSYLLCKNNFCTEYWWWPDLANSLDFIEEQACSEHNSTIRPRKDWQENIQKGFKRFIELEGISPVQIPDASFDQVKAKLKKLFTTHI